MADIAGLPPIVGAGPVGRPNVNAGQVLFVAASDVIEPSEASDAQRAGTPSALTTALPGPRLDENTLTSPPPAFQVSLLELDAALLKSLARINAEQSFAKANPEREKALEILAVAGVEPDKGEAQEASPLAPMESLEDEAWPQSGAIRPAAPLDATPKETPPDVIPQTQITKPAMAAFGPVSTAAIPDPLGAER